ncbi:TadE family protein [Vampirovibrio sp.]|uniref:TadE family protein n=1 Tax=Vampirovibrio sp. TaxID=2717857 RepID=UPI0035939F26
MVCKPCGKPDRKNRAQSGQAVIEMVAGIVMFTIMLALVMSISMYLYFQQALVTAAREGARQASLSSELGNDGSEQAGINAVQAYVITSIRNLTGQQASPAVATITVVPPSASLVQNPGERTVTVNIEWQMNNPVGISRFLNALGADGRKFQTFPVFATATMRYEE